MFVEFLKANFSLFSGEYSSIADRIIVHQGSNYGVFEHHTNIIELGGIEEKTLVRLINYIKTIPSKRISEFSEKQSFTFMHSAEGYGSDDLFEVLHYLVDLFNGDEYCSYYNLALNIRDLYIDFCKRKGIDPKIGCDTLPQESYGFGRKDLQLKNSVRYYAELENYDKNQLKEKLFCSFNLRPIPFRYGLIASYYYYDLVQDGHISSPYDFFSKYDINIDISTFIENVEDFFSDSIHKSEILNSVQNNLHKYPLVLDDRKSYVDVVAASTSDELKIVRKSSLIEIVSESQFNGPVFFTEKTFWPIYFKKPFILVSSKHSLQYLKDMGYKTFEPYINESYDSIESGSERILAITKEINRLKNLKIQEPDKFQEIYSNMLEITEHNYQIFMEIKT